MNCAKLLSEPLDEDILNRSKRKTIQRILRLLRNNVSMIHGFKGN